MRIVKPTRSCRLLLGFLHKGEVAAIFKQAPFEIENLAEPADLLDLRRRYVEAIQGLSDTPPVSGVQILTPSDCLTIAEVRARGTYRKHYEAVADYQFAMVPANALLTPQWFADADYIQELSLQLLPDADLDQQIRFAMAEGTITEPVIAGAQVVFSSQRRDLHADPVPVVRQIESGEFEIIVRASSRPNYIQVAAIGNRLLLTNGVHKVCALVRQGFSHVPCVLRTVARIEECGLNMQTSLLRPDLLNGNRPAQVIDFLNDAVAIPARLRSMYQVLRVGVGVEAIDVPAISQMTSAVLGQTGVGGTAGTMLTFEATPPAEGAELQ